MATAAAAAAQREGAGTWAFRRARAGRVCGRGVEGKTARTGGGGFWAGGRGVRMRWVDSGVDQRKRGVGLEGVWER